MGDSAEKQERVGFFQGVKAEFKKIIWPDKHSSLRQAIAVVIVSVVLGCIISLLDFCFTYGFNYLFDKL